MSLLEKLGNINQLTYKVLHDMNSCYVILKYNLPKVNTLMIDYIIILLQSITLDNKKRQKTKTKTKENNYNL